VLYSFGGQPDGAIPAAGLIVNAKGNLYGTTYSGGASGWGTVFELTPQGAETVVHSFTGGPDGLGPAASLVQVNGNLFSTTVIGGANSFGAVFELTPAHQETVLASLTIADGGGYPEDALIRDAQGNLYGTASGYNGGYGNGAVFEVTTTGNVIVLYEFSGGADGLCPYGGLVRDAAGNLYGTTYRGGASGEGTVFEVAANGTETVLHSFTGTPDGSLPAAGLLRDKKGNLYGTTTGGGSQGYGTVFKVTSNGAETVLHSFTSSDGFYPIANLVRDAKGNLYGTTEFGGSHGSGTVFVLTAAGTEKVLHSFAGGVDGGNPTAGLVFGPQGKLYGTTSAGGNSSCVGGCGVVFELIP
jgi:uncharacterized repeat protein (TIGR03803 family)